MASITFLFNSLIALLLPSLFLEDLNKSLIQVLIAVFLRWVLPVEVLAGIRGGLVSCGTALSNVGFKCLDRSLYKGW